MQIEVKGVDFATVPTRNYEESAKFYGEVLGLEFGKRWGDMPAGEFETGNLTLALMQMDAFGQEFSPNGGAIALHVDDVAAARAELESKGVDVPHGRHRQRRLPHGVLQRSRRQPADAPPPLRADADGPGEH